MSESLSLGGKLSKRVISRDSHQVKRDLTGIYFKVFYFDNNSEVEVLDDPTVVQWSSTGVYYIDLYLDPNIFSSDVVYHYVLGGVSPTSSISTELLTGSFSCKSSDSNLIVSFG